MTGYGYISFGKVNSSRGCFRLTGGSKKLLGMAGQMDYLEWWNVVDSFGHSCSVTDICGWHLY